MVLLLRIFVTISRMFISNVHTGPRQSLGQPLQRYDHPIFLMKCQAREPANEGGKPRTQTWLGKALEIAAIIVNIKLAVRA